MLTFDSLEVVLSEKQPQGQAVNSHGVLATCRLPWQFRVGKPPNGRVAGAATAGGTVTLQTGAENLCDQLPIAGDTLTPRPCVEALRSVPQRNARELLVQPTSVFSPPSGEPRVILTPYPQTDIPCPQPDPNPTTRPPTIQRKRRWDVADLDDGNLQTATGRPQVRPRLGAVENVGAGGRKRNTRSNPSRPHPTTALTGHEANPAMRGSGPSNERSAVSTAGATPSGPLPPSSSESDSETTPEPSHNDATRSQQRIACPPDTQENDTIPGTDGVGTALQSTNPGQGPVTGGIPIWLSVINPPTRFPLFARFGTNVTAAVSSHMYALFALLNSPIVFRKSQHIGVHAPFCELSWTSSCYTITLL